MLANDFANDADRVRNRHGNFGDRDAARADRFHRTAGFGWARRPHHRHDADFADSFNYVLKSHNCVPNGCNESSSSDARRLRFHNLQHFFQCRHAGIPGRGHGEGAVGGAVGGSLLGRLTVAEPRPLERQQRGRRQLGWLLSHRQRRGQLDSAGPARALAACRFRSVSVERSRCSVRSHNEHPGWRRRCLPDRRDILGQDALSFLGRDEQSRWFGQSRILPL